ncbi:MAG: hypothetical protein ACKO37_06330 [Vampirovibrionales bacterium]
MFPHQWQKNPEKWLVLIFPAITLGVLLGGLVLYWAGSVALHTLLK